MVVKTRQNCLSPLTHKQYLFQIGNSRTASIIVYAVTDMGFPHSSISKESACNVGDLGSIPGSERPPGEGNGFLLPVQYSCLGNPMDRGAWWATVNGITRVRHDLVTKLLNHVTDVLEPSPVYLIVLAGILTNIK